MADALFADQLGTTLQLLSETTRMDRLKDNSTVLLACLLQFTKRTVEMKEQVHLNPTSKLPP